MEEDRETPDISSIREVDLRRDLLGDEAIKKNVRGCWNLACLAVLLAAAIVFLDGVVLNALELRPLFGAPASRLTAVVFCFSVLALRVTAAFHTGRENRALSLAAILCIFALLIHPIVGVRGLATASWMHGGYLVIAKDGTMPSSTQVSVFGELPYTRSVYSNITGLSGSDIRLLQRDHVPSAEGVRIVVGDGLYFTPDAEK